MIDHYEKVTVVTNTAFADRLIDLRRFHYGSIVVPTGHTGDIGFHASPCGCTTNGQMAIDNSNFRVQVTVRANSLGHYPLPSYLFDYAHMQLWTQIGGTARVQLANKEYIVTLKE